VGASRRAPERRERELGSAAEPLEQRGRAERFRCPTCGAWNKATAQWCGQCLARFDSGADDAVSSRGPGREPSYRAVASTPPEAPSRPEMPRGARPRAESAAPPSAAGAAAFHATEAGIAWTCRLCGHDNELERRACAVCDSLLAETLRPKEPPGPARDPGKAALMSLLWPGAGHAYSGQWGQAIARAVTSVWVVAVGLATAAQGGPGSPAALVFGLASFLLWLVCAHDAYRVAARESGAVLLTERAFVFVVLGLVVLSVGTVLMTAARAGA
jgi:hypothetical protein